MSNIETLRRWVQDYKDDEPPIRVGQEAAVTAMDYLLGVFGRQGDINDNGPVLEMTAATEEVRRMLEILNAFHGRMSLMCKIKEEE